MRTLLILRHGTAAPEETGSDHERLLTAEGRKAAERVGKWLRTADLLPDRILSSAARRAADTARAVAKAAGYVGPRDELEELYLAEPDAYITALKLRAGGAQRPLIVGHNPGLEALTLILTGEELSLPTAGLVVCALPHGGFEQLSGQAKGKVLRFVRPKDLAG